MTSRQKNSMNYTFVDLVLDIKPKVEFSKIDYLVITPYITSTAELLNDITLMNLQLLQIITHIFALLSMRQYGCVVECCYWRGE
jgi:hypothetical protein